MATINIQSTLDQIKGLLQGVYIDNLPLIQVQALAYLSATEARLEILLAGLTGGDILPDNALASLQAEGDILISELKSFEELGLSLAQRTINNVQTLAVSIFENSLSK